MANLYADAFKDVDPSTIVPVSNSTPLGNENAQNTAQRSKKTSDGLVDDHKEVSSQDYKPYAPSSSDINSDTGRNVKTGEMGRVISSGSKSDVGVEIGVVSQEELQHERDLVQEHANKEIIDHLTEREMKESGVKYADAKRLAERMFALHQAKKENEVAEGEHDLDKKTKELKASSAIAQYNIESSKVDPTDDDAVQKHQELLSRLMPNIVGTDLVDPILKKHETILDHISKIGKIAQQRQRFEERANIDQMASTAFGNVQNLQSLEEVQDFKKSPLYSSLASDIRHGTSIRQITEQRQRELQTEKYMEDFKVNPQNYEEYLYSYKGETRKGLRPKKDVNPFGGESTAKPTSGATTPLVRPAPKVVMSPASKPSPTGQTSEEESYSSDGTSLIPSTLPPAPTQVTTTAPSGSIATPKLVEGKKYTQKGVVYQYTNGQFIPVQ